MRDGPENCVAVPEIPGVDVVHGGALGLGERGEVGLEGGLALGVGFEGMGAAPEIRDVAELGGSLVGDLDEGELAPVEPDERTGTTEVGAGVDDGEMEGLLAHVDMATGTPENAADAALEVGGGCGLELGLGHASCALDGFETNQLEEMPLAGGALEDLEALVVDESEVLVTGGTDVHGVLPGRPQASRGPDERKVVSVE